MKGVFSFFGHPRFLRGFHGWMTVVWGALIYPTLIFWHSSILWVALMSVWANFVGHFSSWQAARVEVRQDEQIHQHVPKPARFPDRDAVTGRFTKAP